MKSGINQAERLYTLPTEKISSENIKRSDFVYCLRCGRKLKSLDAKERGMGKICWEKSHVEKERRRLFDANHNT